MSSLSSEICQSNGQTILTDVNLGSYSGYPSTQMSSIITDELNAETALQWVVSNIKVSKIQEFIFLETWNGKTYQETAAKNRYNYSYIKDAGHRLWRKLSTLTGESVTKHNCRAVVSHYYRSKAQRSIANLSNGQSHELDNFIMARRNKSNITCLYESEKIAHHLSFRGRAEELSTLIEWIVLHNLRLIGVFGMAGIGKTALVQKCTECVKQYFDIVLWRSLRDQPDFDSLMRNVLSCIEIEKGIEPSRLTSDIDTNELVSKLLDYFEESRILIVFDDWSSVFKDNVLAGMYTQETEKYGLFLRRLGESSHNSCVLITSRETPSGLVFKQRGHQNFSQVASLHVENLTTDDGFQALTDFGLPNSSSVTKKQLLNYYSGNPYALKIAVNTICSLFEGKTNCFLTQKNLIYGEIKILLESQITRISETEKEILIALSKAPLPVTFTHLISDLSDTINSGHLLESLESLINRNFIQQRNDVFEIQEILKNYLLNY